MSVICGVVRSCLLVLSTGALLCFASFPPGMSCALLVCLTNSGLIQLRNEMAHYIRSSSEKWMHGDSEHCDWPFGQLPQPINNEKICEGCPQLLACAVYQRSAVFFMFLHLEWVVRIALFGILSVPTLSWLLFDRHFVLCLPRLRPDCLKPFLTKSLSVAISAASY